MAPAPDRALLQLRGAQDFEIDRVIQIVAVVGDLVRQIRDLRFERWTIFSSPATGRLVKRLMLFAGPRAPRTSDSIPENSDTSPPATRPPAGSACCARSRRARACTRPASPRRNARRANGRDHARARSPRPDPRSTTSARAIVRLIDATSIVCVSRVRKMIARPVEKNLRLVFQPPKARANE